MVSAGREIRTPELQEHRLSRPAPYRARLSQLSSVNGLELFNCSMTPKQGCMQRAMAHPLQSGSIVSLEEGKGGDNRPDCISDFQWSGFHKEANRENRRG